MGDLLKDIDAVLTANRVGMRGHRLERVFPGWLDTDDCEIVGGRLCLPANGRIVRESPQFSTAFQCADFGCICWKFEPVKVNLFEKLDTPVPLDHLDADEKYPYEYNSVM